MWLLLLFFFNILAACKGGINLSHPGMEVRTRSFRPANVCDAFRKIFSPVHAMLVGLTPCVSLVG